MNPKLQAIKASGLYDLDELPGVSAPQIGPVSPLVAEEGIAAHAHDHTHDMHTQQTAKALEDKLVDLEGRVRNLPLHLQQQYFQEIQAARGLAQQGLPADLASLDAAETKIRAVEGEKIQDVGMSLAMAPAILSFMASGELPHLEATLLQAHPKLAKEYELLSDHGVPGSGRSADPFNLGALQVPAGLPAISRQLQMARNEGYVRNIADDKKL